MMLMSSGTKCEFGDIHTVPFPFTSNPGQSKKRPVVVISSSSYNAGTPDVVCCGITSNLSNKGFDVPIGTKDMEDGTLPADSLIKYGYIYTLEKGIIGRKIGRIDAKTRRLLVRELASLFDGT